MDCVFYSIGILPTPRGHTIVAGRRCVYRMTKTRAARKLLNNTHTYKSIFPSIYIRVLRAAVCIYIFNRPGRGQNNPPALDCAAPGTVAGRAGARMQQQQIIGRHRARKIWTDAGGGHTPWRIYYTRTLQHKYTFREHMHPPRSCQTIFEVLLSAGIYL